MSGAVSVAAVLGAGAFLLATPAQAAPVNLCPSGQKAGRCNDPLALAVDHSSGDLYVADRNNFRVDEFAESGAFLRAFGLGVRDGADELQTCSTICRNGSVTAVFDPRSLAVDESTHDLYVLNANGAKIEQYALNGSEEFELIHSFAGPGTGPGQLSGSAHPLAFDAAGHLWAGDHERLEEFSAAGGILGEVALPGVAEVSGLAIDPLSGDLYTLTPPVGERSEIQKVIPPPGEYTLSFEGETTAPLPGNAPDAEIQAALEALPAIGAGNVKTGSGASSVSVTFRNALASADVEQMTASGGASVETIQQGAPGTPGSLTKRKPNGEAIEALDAAGHPTALALGPAGGLLVSDQLGVDANTGNATLLSYDSTGALTAAFGSGQVIGRPGSQGQGGSLAFGSAAQRLYVASSTGDNGESAVQSFALPEPGPLPVAGSAEATEVHKTSATLCARVNPEGAETKPRFQYILAAQYEKNEEEGHEGFQGAEQTPLSGPLGEDFSFGHQLCQAVSPLLPAAGYRFRMLAFNENSKPAGNAGEAASFETLPPAAIDSASASQVTASSATLEAQINPLGDATSYRFEYLTAQAVAENEAQGREAFFGAALAPLQEAPLGSGSADVFVSQHLQGLAPATAYRFRVRIANAVSAAHGGPYPGPSSSFATQSLAAASGLPDGRGYELVSPPEKGGGVLGISGLPIQAAASGDAIAYPAINPTEADPPSNANFLQVLSRREGPGSWASRDIVAPHADATGASLGSTGDEYRLFSTDLSRAAFQPFGPFEPSLSPAASEQTPFLRTTFTPGAPGFCTQSCYRPLVTGCPAAGECPAAVQAAADVPAGTQFGSQFLEGGLRGPGFLAATPDLRHVIIQSTVGLTASPEDHGNLYEWSADAPPAESLRKINVLPGGEPSALGAALGGGAVRRDAISSDGRRVVFTFDGHLYLRLNATEEQSATSGPALDGSQCTEAAKACTIQLDALQGGPGGPAGAVYQAASTAGARVFFTDSAPLTPEAGEASGGGGDLYEYDLGKPAGQRLADLTPETAAGERAAVLGTIPGASADGEYVYFVANAALAPGASPGDCKQEGSIVLGECSLYLRHAGQTTFVARLDGADSPDWASGLHELANLTARVSPNGRWLAFMSERPLTGYDNRDAVSGKPDEEVFLYRAPAAEGEAGTLICASCDPTGARPHGAEWGQLVEEGSLLNSENTLWPARQWLAATIPGWTHYTQATAVYQSRYLSDRGRLFFNSLDSLAPTDSNGTADVYTYEPPAAAPEPPPGDTCTEASPSYHSSSGGCVSLISSGASPKESVFMDASELGNDVFFLTSSRLSAKDVDTSLDLYDARSGGGEPEVVKPVECSGDACQQPATPPNDATPGSLTFNGPGNVTECPKGKALRKGKCVTKKHCPKGKVKKSGKCVKKKAHKHHKRAHRRPGSNRGGHK